MHEMFVWTGLSEMTISGRQRQCCYVVVLILYTVLDAMYADTALRFETRNVYYVQSDGGSDSGGGDGGGEGVDGGRAR